MDETEQPQPAAVENVAGADLGGGSVEVDGASVSPATSEAEVPQEPFVLVTPSGEELRSLPEAEAWLDAEFDSIASRIPFESMGKIMAILRNRVLRGKLARGEARRIDMARTADITPAEAVEILRGLRL